MSRNPEPRPTIPAIIRSIANRHSTWQTFSDFVEMAAISLSNAVDLRYREKREARYRQIVKGYQPDEVEKFCQAMARLVLDMEEAPADVLGRCYHELELTNKWAGQLHGEFARW